MSKSGTTIQYKYDHNGLRVAKIVNGTETSYTLHGKLITHMKKGSDNLHFFYDAQSRPAKVNFNGTMYTYIHNLQGDIAGILDNNGTLVVEYKYDAWGKKLSVTGNLAATLGTLNPFRYRGYVFDEETGLYYLRSRYYKPNWNRFVSADIVLGQIGRVLQHNAMAYCANNPQTRTDHNGNAWSNIVPEVRGFLHTLSNIDSIMPNFAQNLSKSEGKLMYARDAIVSVLLLASIRNSVTYNSKTGLLRIPNNTRAAESFIEIASYSNTGFFDDYDWAGMMASVAVDKYEIELGKEFHTEIPKVTYEVRVHSQIYMADMFVNHTDITDVSLYEGNGRSFLHVQWWIDLFYGWGAR